MKRIKSIKSVKSVESVTPDGVLRSSYGTVKVPKGTFLYHASTSKLCAFPDKPMIFTTIHPSEWYTIESLYITVIEIQRDIELLFMISLIFNTKVYSSLSNYIDSNNTNLAKIDFERIHTWIPHLHHENLDGWFSSIENKYAIELAIINDPSILKIVECNPIQHNWKNSKYMNNDPTKELIPKYWGTVYPLTIQHSPLRMLLNSRYRTQIEDYKKYITKEDPGSTALSLVLENAEIDYFDAPLEQIKW